MSARARFAPLAAALALLAADASATVTQPNGVVMPKDSMNGEEQLYTMFGDLGEPVDWQVDGNTTPNIFYPLCGFTAQLVLNETASSLAIAWYNAGPNPPSDADLHVIVPAGSPVGTTISSADIKNDPAYAGGPIGFALVGWQTHYSQPQFDPMCSGCNPPAPWISAVIYASKKTANAYYLAFEDGTMGANPNEFNNDGDYNDYVYLLSGLTCSGGGQPCDSGKPGICAAGLTQCTPNGVVCQQQSQPANETCNGLDDDCNGVTDEGDICPMGYVCDKGSCVQKCNSGEFTCPGNLVCSQDGYCVDAACKDVSCPSGKVCVAGTCRAPCDGVICPYPEVCRVGACVDPCAGVTCDEGLVCDKGACVPKCSCAPCGPGLACDATDHCVDPACVGVTCNAGQHCVAGNCVDDCEGAVCPAGQVCDAGACVAGQGGGGGAGSGAGGSPFGEGGAGGAGAGGAGAGGAASTSTTATTAGAGGAGGAPTSGDSGGCGCHTGGESSAGGALAGFLALGLLATRRRRRAAS